MSPEPDRQGDRPKGPFAWWTAMPLYLRILVGLVLGVICGSVFGPAARPLEWAAQIVLRALGALAPALILMAVVQAIMTTEIRGRMALHMGALLILNTTVAILVGLGVANVLKPGAGAHLARPEAAVPMASNIISQLLDNVPDSLVR